MEFIYFGNDRFAENRASSHHIAASQPSCGEPDLFRNMHGSAEVSTRLHAQPGALIRRAVPLRRAKLSKPFAIGAFMRSRTSLP